MLSLRQSFRFVTPVVRSSRAFNTSRVFLQSKTVAKTAQTLSEVNGPETLIGPGGKAGEIPTDLEQATGLERLELLAKLEGIEVFDLKPLDASRKGTMENPIEIESYDDYRYVGCTGAPADSHQVMWLKPTVNQVARCWECGSVYKLKPVGVKTDDGHH